MRCSCFVSATLSCPPRHKWLEIVFKQVSVLVLASTPFSGALLPLSQAAGHAFFNEGPLALAMVSCQDE